MKKVISEFLKSEKKSFKEGVKIYKETAKKIDKSYDKYLKTFENAIGEKESESTFAGILESKLNYTLRRIVQIEEDAKKKVGSKAIAFEEDLKLQYAISKLGEENSKLMDELDALEEKNEKLQLQNKALSEANEQLNKQLEQATPKVPETEETKEDAKAKK